MYQELERELGTGKWFAKELVKHLENMGADKCTIPIKRDGEMYEVEVRRITAMNSEVQTRR